MYVIMAEKISFYGLSGSGKSCFIFAMSQALSQGIQLSDEQLLQVITPDPRQMLRLYKAYEKMVNGSWPAGTDVSVTYNFNVRKALDLLMSIEITDFRGGLLDSLEEDDQEEQEKLFKSYKDSSVLLFFFGADKVKSAMQGNTSALMNFLHFNTLYESYLSSSPNGRNTPVMVIISKSDMLTQSELSQAYAFVKNRMAQLFGKGTNLTVGITAVSLGRNLINDGGELEGELDIRATAGNLSIPVLFSLYHIMAMRIENTVGRIASTESSIRSSKNDLGYELSRSAFSRFFVNNEDEIRKRINSHTAALGDEKNLLLKLNSSMTAIKKFLLSGAELYSNGNRIQ
jgi:hypothetical protein